MGTIWYRGWIWSLFINDPNVKADIIHNENWALSFPFLTSSNQLVIVVGGTIYTNANIQEEAEKQKQEVNNFFSEVKIRSEIITIHCDTNWREVASEIYCLVVLEQIFKKRKEVDEYYYSLEITQDRIIVKANEFLESKKTFLNCRQRTIKELQNCYNELAGSSGYAAIEEVGRAVNSVGEIELTFGIPKALGGLVTAVSNYSKIRSITESNKAFQEYLIYDNNNILPSFNEVYASLLKLIQENEDLEICSRVKNALELQNGKVELFNANYKVFKSQRLIFPNICINVEEMENTILLLSKNLKELKQMETLVKTFRDELKSKSKFSNKCKQRNSELRQLFTNLPSTSKEFSNELEKIKRGLSKKELIEQKIEELYQTNDKLRQLNMNTIIFI
ncbi:kinase-like domain-containing protein [Rhizophagus irregularis DAOM 181602=DAOM 197198]|nr:kinase-like domain-containing protein [Rhizophagus irregularis DAOM 181602=DAOM 197198]